MGSAAHLLVFEADPRGHAEEWLRHILAAAAEHEEIEALTLAVPASLAGRLRPALPEKARLQPLSAAEQENCTAPRLTRSAFARWRAMRQHLERSGATHGLFLGLDHLTLPLALGLGVGGRTLSGILFRPTAHYPAFGCRPSGVKESLRDFRKDLLLRLALRNPALGKVFSLDPFFPAHAQARYARGEKVLPLGDPVFSPPPPRPEERGLAERIPEDRVAFLLFGELTERKGVIPLLEALRLLPSRVARRTAVTLAGRVDTAVAEQVSELIAKLREEQPALWLNCADRWLSAGELAALIEASDVVMAPYQRFVGSSGVLLWAARAGRPVICQDYGLLGQLTERYRLGATVDSRDPRAIAAAIAECVERGPDVLRAPDDLSGFLESRNPEAFAAALLGAATAGDGHPGSPWHPTAVQA